VNYRKLGRTGLRISVIGLGTYQFGGEWNKRFAQSEVDGIINVAADEGINFIDTAECYGDSEELIGRATHRVRSEWIIATKFGHRYDGVPTRSDHWSVAEILSQLETSLRLLQTDYIDLYQFHSGEDDVFNRSAIWDALQRQVEAGKIRYLGISLKSNDNLRQTAAASEVRAGAIQLVYNRLNRAAEDRVLPSCVSQGLGVLARLPLERGLLSGHYSQGTTFPDSDVRSVFYSNEQLQSYLEEVERIRLSEIPNPVDMAPWALAWCLRHPAVTAVIPGCKSMEQVRSNAAAAELAPGDHPQSLD
jgi:aryl-alcohol dehydrogenase-like predicted oxidoreductase